ncbi:pyridoxamine 5'-phosphate oxidase family protein [Microbacterium xanthum]|uniref:pyridoxamine 5'-phosphate oxidase family protein n=1 Tax=Microbacterium xanthum TaxID=3079794 RepID=UPI002AD44B12|nr:MULTISPECIES: pyridoxamine 5'-phosphate oxidase family protein [unclassified Microbacterium]MDZ8171810.1 pyridoxamine 5'-phosphate oxidase family protein [Microbacterium sp. KSW-48]MDZ8200087.1 pyridoxamine 5'-phosphate oxidase family protein [Microbacterium sp. SSW1-59]
MDESSDAVAILDEQQCWQHLAGHQLGRLVTHVGDVLDIFPVNYVVDGPSLVFRTAEGSKLLELTVNDHVLFEVDDWNDDRAWSVVVRGHARRLDHLAEVEAADELPLKPWIPTVKFTYVRVEPTQLTGRAFARGEEPDRDSIQPG